MTASEVLTAADYGVQKIWNDFKNVDGAAILEVLDRFTSTSHGFVARATRQAFRDLILGL